VPLVRSAFQDAAAALRPAVARGAPPRELREAVVAALVALATRPAGVALAHLPMESLDRRSVNYVRRFRLLLVALMQGALDHAEADAAAPRTTLRRPARLVHALIEECDSTARALAGRPAEDARAIARAFFAARLGLEPVSPSRVRAAR
jgi:hypothetical protein